MKRSGTTRVAALLLIGALAGCAKSGGNAAAMASPSSAAAATASAAVAQNGAAANDGGKLYAANCSSCHQPNGQGVQGTFPPLAGNTTVTGDPSVVIHIVKYGLNGKVSVKGTDYNGMMPAWGQSLSNADIASIITYVRSAWGNTAGAVTQAEVTAVSQ
jgi:mono/diheme cytochrome c family protein